MWRIIDLYLEISGQSFRLFQKRTARATLQIHELVLSRILQLWRDKGRHF